MTLLPSFNSLLHKLVPINPAPPVINIVEFIFYKNNKFLITELKYFNVKKLK